MANNKERAELELEIAVEGEDKPGKIGESLKSLGKTTAKVGAVMTAVYAAATAAIVKFGKTGIEFRTVRNAFSNLAASQGQDADKMLGKMRELSGGTIKDLELMKQANNALLLGLPVDKFGEMVKIARGASAATGESMQFMLRSIVTGLGRGSKLMLDNLGILVDQNKAQEVYARSLDTTVEKLTETQRKQAFVNAALKAGVENLKNQGGVTDNASDKWKNFGVRMENMADKLSVFVIPAFREVIRSTEPMIKAFEDIASSPFVKDVAVSLTKGFTFVNVAIETVTAVLQEKLLPIFKSIPALLRGEFAKASAITEASTKSISEILVEQRKALNNRLSKVDQDFSALEAENDKKAAAEKIRRGRELREAIEQQKAEQAEIDLVTDVLQKEEEKERERLFREALKDTILSEKFKEINALILAEKDFQKKLLLVRERAALKASAIDAERAKRESVLDDVRQRAKIDNMSKFFSVAESLSTSGNKTLQAIGKAAALTRLAIQTPEAVGSAFKFGTSIGGPPLGFAMGGIAAAAMGAQAAQVAGVQLADGGIVSARQGGTQAILGEGGQDEAVVPLDDAGGGIGTTINITVNGGMLGDESSAREFAVEVDKQLLSLRQDNSSVAFDTDVI